MAWFGKNKKGKDVVLLNPAEKADKFARELKSGVRQTNKGELKQTDSGESVYLSNTQKAFRSGYLSARQDSARAYKHNMKKKN